MIAGAGGFNGALHPRVAAGSAGGGRFAAKGGSSSSAPAAKATAKAKAGKGKKTTQPNGLGYSAKQWADLQKLEAQAKAGKKLTPHQKHELHVAHMKREQALGLAPKPAAKPRPRTAAKPKTARKATARKTSTARKTVTSPVTRRAAIGK